MDLVGGSYAIGADRDTFEADTRLGQIGGIVIHAMDAGFQSVTRTRAHIRRDGLEHFSLHLNHAGYDFRSARGEGRLAGGEISINDLAQPFERSGALERNSVVLSLPRDAVERVAPDRALHGAILNGAVGALLAAHMQMLASRMSEVPPAAAQRLMDATTAMLGAALAPSGPESRSFDAARTLAVKRHIRKNLSRLSLSPETVARDMRMSRTKLYSLFEAEGGVAHYIAQRRLAAAAEALRNGDELRPISALALACGFASPSAFSRAFRARYGASARDYRAAQGLPSDDFNHRAYATWLRQLG